MSVEEYRGLGWKYGSLVVQQFAAMIAPITFVLPNGQQVSPMQIAPWADEPVAKTVDGVLSKLRGEWPCVPFGGSPPKDGFAPEWAAVMGPPEPGEEAHGYAANHAWTWETGDAGQIAMSIDLPASDPIARLERTVTPDPGSPTVELTLTVHARRDCSRSMGLHGTYRLPAAPQQARIEPAKFREGRTYPGIVEPGTEYFAFNRGFSSLSKVPLLKGGETDASLVPLPVDTEELLQLNDIAGEVCLANLAEGYRVRQRWQAEHFPSLLLWYSNRGRTGAPWLGRHLGLGMEPVISPFGLGPSTAAADNPFTKAGTPTARRFKAGEVFTTRYRISAEAL